VIYCTVPDERIYLMYVATVLIFSFFYLKQTKFGKNLMDSDTVQLLNCSHF
jgi:hypothetical protein